MKHGTRTGSSLAKVGAGQRGAILYSIIERCRWCQIDPYAYLRDVLTWLPTMTTNQIADITPANWLKARQAAPKPMAYTLEREAMTSIICCGCRSDAYI